MNFFCQDDGDDDLSAIKGRNSGGEGGHDHVDLDFLEGRGGAPQVYSQHPESQTERRLLQTNNADEANAANEELLAGISSYRSKVAAMPNDERKAFVQVHAYAWVEGWMYNCVCVCVFCMWMYACASITVEVLVC